jgi:phosphatidylglycerophosphatase C
MGAVSPPVVAAFDVDGTLTTGDCVVPFLRQLAGTRGSLAAIARRPLAVVAALARRDRDRLKEVVVGAVHRGRTVEDVAVAGKDFAARVLETRMRPDMLARLRWHQGRAHRTILVSASLRAYLEPLAAALGIDHVLCTDVLAAAGRYTDRLVGANCRGAEKAVRLRALLEGEGLADAELWAYGDTTSDRPLLELADHAVWVGTGTVPAVPEGFAR